MSTADDLRGRSDVADWSAEMVEDLLHACLTAGDIKGVDACMRVLAVKDPHRADELRVTMLAAIALTTEKGSQALCSCTLVGGPEGFPHSPGPACKGSGHE